MKKRWQRLQVLLIITILTQRVIKAVSFIDLGHEKYYKTTILELMDPSDYIVLMIDIWVLPK